MMYVEQQNVTSPTELIFSIFLSTNFKDVLKWTFEYISFPNPLNPNFNDVFKIAFEYISFPPNKGAPLREPDLVTKN